MTFPSDYKVVKLPGTTTGVLDTYTGYERQLLVDTETWNLRLMDGTTPGGHTLVNFSDFASLFLNSAVVEQGTKLSVEVATGTGSDADLIAASNKVRPWAPLVLRTLFEKIANTATAGTWKILDSAMPDALKAAARPVSDLNTALLDGFYTVDPSSASNLPGAVSTVTTLNLAMIVSSQTTDNVMQMLIERGGSAKIWIRARIDGDWQAWVLATGVTSVDLATKVSKSGDTMTGPLDMNSQPLSRVLSYNGGPANPENECINGMFAFWQRGTSSTATGYSTADRFTSVHLGTTKVVSQQPNVLGDSVHGDPWFIRHVVTSVAGANNYAGLSYRGLNVRKFAGKRVTLTFEAKADSAKDIALEAQQFFGGGGSPSATITAIGPQRVTLGTTWQKYSVVFDFPSIAGKTLGTNGQDCSVFSWFFDAGSSLNARTANLGQQSGTFDIRHVSIRQGDARSEADPFGPWIEGKAWLDCLGFFRRVSDAYLPGHAWTTTRALFGYNFETWFRAPPTVFFNNLTSMQVRTTAGPGTGINLTTLTAPNISQRSLWLDASIGSAGLTAGHATTLALGAANSFDLDCEI